MILLEGLLTAPAVLLFPAAARYAFFAFAGLVGSPAARPAGPPRTRFCVLIPAHDEEAHVAVTVAAARRFAYPPELFRVLVLADNCTDGTAEQARRAGAEVVERRQPDNPGKGQAVAWAVAQHLRPDEALLICDADSRPAPDYLFWMDRVLAAGYGAAQGFNGSANPEQSSLAALAALTGTMKNRLHYTGKAVLDLPTPLMNGLTIAADTWRAHPWRAFSITEDFETYLYLVDEGVKIGFAPEAMMLSPRATGFAAASTQKARWSGGQHWLARTVARPMARRALRSFSLYRLSAALDLLVPGYAPLSGMLLALAALCLVLLPGLGHPATLLALAGLGMMIAQFAIGLAFMKPTPALARAVLLAPFYIAWKIPLALRSRLRRPAEWRRADRDERH